MEPHKKAIVLALATALAVPAEGIRQYAYRDPVGLPTICMGSTKGVRMGDFRTLPECRALLTKEMIDAIDQVDRCQPNLPPQALAAFADAAYNIGPTIVCDARKSTAARLLNAGQLREACQQLPRWDKARIAGIAVTLPGLTKRRSLEMALCLQATA